MVAATLAPLEPGAIHEVASAIAATADARGARATGRLRVGYLRRKRGRGLVAVYGVAPSSTTVSWRTLVLRVPEAEPGSFDRTDVESWWLPRDPAMPGLTQMLGDGEVAAVVPEPVRAHLGSDDASVKLVRYKPGDRAVLRYDARGGHGERAVFAKVFGKASSAVAVDRLLTAIGGPGALRASSSDRAIVPLALGHDGEVAAAFTAGVVGDRERPARSGLDVLRPSSGDAVVMCAIDSAARAIARLHAGAPLDLAIHDCASDIAAVGQRLQVVQGWIRAGEADVLCDQLAAAAERTVAALDALAAVPPATTHGACKPSQLVFVGEHAVLTDVDGARRGDPARDLGYMLAYLRPAAPRSRSAVAHGWFAAARAEMTDRYERACLELGGHRTELPDRVRRAHVFEAAILMKIAARRANRLQAPRRHEVAGLVAGMHAALDSAGG